MLPRPKWYQEKLGKRHSTGDLINNLKAEAYAKSMGMNFSRFVKLENKTRSLRNIANPAMSAMFYVRN